MSTHDRWTSRFAHLWAPPRALRRAGEVIEPVSTGLVDAQGRPARPALRTAGPARRQGPSRRGVMRGLLGGSVVTVGLPWLEIFAGRSARAESLYPLRFGVWFWGNGNRPERFVPEGEGEDWELSEELAPLANVKDYLTIVSGMAVKVPNYIPHWSGAGGLLTGLDAVGDDEDWTVSGPSIDQMVADEIGEATIYKSIEVGLETDEVFSFTGPNARNPGESDPLTLYERIFGETFREPGEDTEPDPRLGYRRSVLDAVMTDIGALQSTLGSEDQVRLEAHLDGIRDLEKRLAKLQEDPPDLESCTRPEEPEASYPDVDGRPDIESRARALHDVMAMALACDQTRVFHFQISKPVSNLMFPGVSDGHHNLTHDEPAPQEEVHEITVHIMEQLAYFLEALASIPEGEGTLLDNCCIMGTSEHGEAQTHDIRDIPIILAGSAQGALKQGVHYRSYTEENAGKVTLSLIRAMGINAVSWGAEDTYTEDGLGDIEA